MKIIKKGVIVNCSRNPRHIDIYDVIIEDGGIYLKSSLPNLNEIEKEEDDKRIIKYATWLALDFFYSYVSRNHRRPKIKEFIPVLAYELEVSIEEAWKIFEALNFFGVVLIDGEEFYIGIP